MPEEKIDQEILPYFIEESKKSLDEIEQTLHRWHEHSDDSQLKSELTIHFHTLKGAANMVGHHRIGNITGQMKYLLESLELETFQEHQLKITKIAIETMEMAKKILAESQDPTLERIDITELMNKISSYRAEL